MTQAEAFLDVKQWGNNLGVRLPLAVARAAHLHANQRVRVAVEDGRVIITPVDHAEQTLEERLAKFDPARHGGEAMAAEPVGAEKW
jgi:antitoxin MazE